MICPDKNSRSSVFALPNQSCKGGNTPRLIPRPGSDRPQEKTSEKREGCETMARPKKTDDVFNVRVDVRMAEADKKTLCDRAKKAALSLSEYIRRISLNGEITIGESRANIGEIKELNKIGVNLNQMTKHMNAGRDVFAPAILATLERVNAYLDKAEAP